MFPQESLLRHLGVNPAGSDDWPFTVHPHTLAVLAEVLLLQQQKERVSPPGRGSKNSSEAAIINVWSRLLSSLRTAILGFSNNTLDFEGTFFFFLSPGFSCHTVSPVWPLVLLLNIAMSISPALSPVLFTCRWKACSHSVVSIFIFPATFNVLCDLYCVLNERFRIWYNLKKFFFCRCQKNYLIWDVILLSRKFAKSQKTYC